MLAAFGFGVVVMGAAVACVAPRYARVSVILETTAGILVVAGLVMIGSQLKLPI